MSILRSNLKVKVKSEFMNSTFEFDKGTPLQGVVFSLLLFDDIDLSEAKQKLNQAIDKELLRRADNKE